MADFEMLKQAEDEQPVVTKGRSNRFRLFVGLGILGAVVIFFLGFVIGYFAMKARASDSPVVVPTCISPVKVSPTKKVEELHKWMVNSLTAESVEEFSR